MHAALIITVYVYMDVCMSIEGHVKSGIALLLLSKEFVLSFFFSSLFLSLYILSFFFLLFFYLIFFFRTFPVRLENDKWEEKEATHIHTYIQISGQYYYYYYSTDNKRTERMKKWIRCTRANTHHHHHHPLVSVLGNENNCIQVGNYC